MRVKDLGFGVQGLGFRVSTCYRFNPCLLSAKMLIGAYEVHLSTEGRTQMNVMLIHMRAKLWTPTKSDLCTDQILNFDKGVHAT